MNDAQMAITLKINHALADFVPRRMIDREMHIKIQPNVRIDEVIRNVVGLPDKVVPLIFVNGRHAKPHDRLASGDRLTLWMPMAGG
jgi:hypothetical protein